MPNRIIREAILSSERVAMLDWPAEVFYRRLQSVVDDYGRHEAGHQLLRAKCYPLQTDSVRVADIARWMAACQKSGLILVYGVNQKQYLEIANFGQQTRTASKCPPPPSIDGVCEQLIANDFNCEQVPTNAHLGVVVSVVEDVGVDARKRAATPKTKKPIKTTLPDDFAISERVREWAKKNNHGQLDAHLDAFRIKSAKQGYTYADWDSAFMEAIRENWASLQPQRTASPSAFTKTPSETPLERAIGFAKHQFDLGVVTAEQRDQSITDARVRHEGAT